MIADPVAVLTQYDVSPVCGFLPDQPPLQRLETRYYEAWENFIVKLPYLITHRLVRLTVDGMPILDTMYLSSEHEWRRAYLILSFMAHAYIWSGDEPSQTLPPNICIPYHEIADHFGLPSTATYAALNLWNWKPAFPGVDITNPDNIRILHSFTGTADEDWFYLISVSIEAEGAKIIPTMLECFDAVKSNNSLKTIQLLRIVNESILKMGTILDRMHERCDPEIFYHQLRPFLAGSKGMTTAGLPNGVFYDEGQGQGSWRQYSGGSNAQSSLIQLLDIMLGIEHYATGSADSAKDREASKRKHAYIEDMRRYMPEKHKRFLQHITTVANVRPYAMQVNADVELRATYIRAVESLTIFRNKHISIVARYIIAQSQKPSTGRRNTIVNIATASEQNHDDKVNKRTDLCGTGGTQLIPFLKQTRDETKQAGTVMYISSTQAEL